MKTSYNPTMYGLAEAIVVLSDTVKEPLVVHRTAYGYHIETLASHKQVVPSCPDLTDLYDEVLLCNIV